MVCIYMWDVFSGHFIASVLIKNVNTYLLNFDIRC